MRVVEDRLSLRWHLGYDLHETLPDHSTLARIRERYGLEVVRQFFEATVQQCINAGLVWGEEMYFDATRVEANASVSSMVTRFAVEQHVSELFAGNEESTDDPGGDDREDEEAEPNLLSVEADENELRGLEEANLQRHDWIHDWIEEAGRPQRRAVRAITSE